MEAELPAELAAPEPAVATSSVGSPVAGPIRDAFQKAVADAGNEFAREWGREVSLDELRAVLELPTWRIPPDIDRLLLVAADRELGFLRENPDLKGALRLGFKQELAKILDDRERSAGDGEQRIEPVRT